MLERLPGTFQKDPVLRIHVTGLARAKPKKPGIKPCNVIEDALGRYIVWVTCNRLGYTRGDELLNAKVRNRLFALTQVVPELLKRVGTRKAPGHANDGNGVGCCHGCLRLSSACCAMRWRCFWARWVAALICASLGLVVKAPEPD